MNLNRDLPRYGRRHFNRTRRINVPSELHGKVIKTSYIVLLPKKAHLQEVRRDHVCKFDRYK